MIRDAGEAVPVQTFYVENWFMELRSKMKK
jgi:hypothetical protein